MTTRFILEEVAIVENDFTADSRDRDGLRVVTYESRRAIQLHLATDHIVQIEAVRDAKLADGRSIVTLSSGHRYVTKRSAVDVIAAITKVTETPA
jgi:uncharacterized protein YlzI (FlbEa/FlbD family)